MLCKNIMTTNNPYLPPSAPLDLITDGQDNRFYIVSIKKFWTLYILTLGTYQIYWNFKHWASYKKATDSKLWPVARAIFALFFYHKLNEEIHAQAARNQVTLRWDHKMIATLMVVLAVGNGVLSRFGEKIFGALTSNFLVLLILPALGYLMSIVQNAANKVSGDPGGSRNSDFTPLNYLWMFLGVCFWLLMLIGVWIIIKGG
jgi:hypothetical protein